MRLDGKVRLEGGKLIRNKDGKEVPEDEFIVFRPADNALLPTLYFYLDECRRQGAQVPQVAAVLDLIRRVVEWRQAHPDRIKVPAFVARRDSHRVGHHDHRAQVVMTSKKKPLLALTLWRPWPLLIASGIKTIENRPWHPRPRLEPGEWFAIHSGKKWDGERCIPMAQELGVPIGFFDKKDVESTISCVARYDGHSDDHEEIVRKLGPDRARWHFAGQIGWILGDAQAIEPIPCAKGMQGLWLVPDDVADKIRAAFKKARASMGGAG